MPDARTFWGDFRARARLRPQEETVPVGARPVPALRWAVAAACVLVMAAWVVVHHGPTAVSRPGASIKSLEVVASHSAVLIMSDEPSEATILWVVDMEIDDINGGSA